jgi:hypothetical protein
MAFNNYTSFAICASKVVRGTKSVADLLKFPAWTIPTNSNARTRN